MSVGWQIASNQVGTCRDPPLCINRDLGVRSCSGPGISQSQYTRDILSTIERNTPGRIACCGDGPRGRQVRRRDIDQSGSVAIELDGSDITRRRDTGID